MSLRETDRILDQLRRAFEGEAWHGPAVLELLREVSAKQAAEHAIPGAHSIWEITLHIAAWEGAVNRRLQGDRAELPADEDWPHVAETTEAAWQAARANLETVHREFMEAISRLDELRLDGPILEGMSSVYTTLHGAIQHDLYHAGQIALLKKASKFQS